MAANWAQFNNYLTDTLGIASAEVRQAIHDEGLNSFAELVSLKEKDMKQICANIRKPGGTIPNPAAGQPGQPPMITNPGLRLGLVLEQRLEKLRYFAHHCRRIQRLCTPQTATLARLNSVYTLKEKEDEKEDKTVELPKQLVKIDDARVLLEDLDEYLVRTLGEGGLPLAYVVRDTVALPADDPGWGQPSYTEEMIARGDHTLVEYQTDNISVWKAIRHLTHGGLAWSWVSQYSRTSNGRLAYIAIKTHYLGDSYQSRIKSSAEVVLKKAFYDGNARTFTFESYCASLQKAFADLEGAGEEVSEARKVRILLEGITDTKMQVPVANVYANTDLKATFESAVNYLSQQNDLIQGRHTRARNVSALGGKKNDKKDKKDKKTPTKKEQGTKKVKFTDAYMKPEKWWALTDEQRQAIRDKRAARDQRRGVQVVTTTPATPASVSDVSTSTAGTTNPSAQTQQVGAAMSRRTV